MCHISVNFPSNMTPLCLTRDTNEGGRGDGSGEEYKSKVRLLPLVVPQRIASATSVTSSHGAACAAVRGPDITMEYSLEEIRDQDVRRIEEEDTEAFASICDQLNLRCIYVLYI